MTYALTMYSLFALMLFWVLLKRIIRYAKTKDITLTMIDYVLLFACAAVWPGYILAACLMEDKK